MREITGQIRTLHVYPMAQIKYLGTMSSAGPVAMSGPVSRVAALDDRVTSSGGPILGAAGVPRPRRGLLRRLRQGRSQ
jgi:hypothetical protein